MFTRYALYFAPHPDSALARLGASWLGRDASTGPVEQATPALPGCRPLADLTAAPRRYGLHGTLKAPMRLAPGCNADDLIETAAAWAAGRAPVDLGHLQVAALGPFLALVPGAQPPALERFAADLVRDFDRFRAPPTPAELARRKQHPLTPRQNALLEAWGYPYVMEEFRFHITLSDALASAERPIVQAAAEAHLATALDRPEVMRDLAVFGEDESGIFHLLTRLALRG